jgi:hypothetical protein
LQGEHLWIHKSGHKKSKELSGLIKEAILGKLNSLESNLNKGHVATLIEELAKYDFYLF